MGNAADWDGREFDSEGRCTDHLDIYKRDEVPKTDEDSPQETYQAISPERLEELALDPLTFKEKSLNFIIDHAVTLTILSGVAVGGISYAIYHYLTR
jgi:hypothetical protein